MQLFILKLVLGFFSIQFGKIANYHCLAIPRLSRLQTITIYANRVKEFYLRSTFFQGKIPARKAGGLRFVVTSLRITKGAEFLESVSIKLKCFVIPRDEGSFSRFRDLFFIKIPARKAGGLRSEYQKIGVYRNIVHVK